jgi:hypothetical protein
MGLGEQRVSEITTTFHNHFYSQQLIRDLPLQVAGVFFLDLSASPSYTYAEHKNPGANASGFKKENFSWQTKRK